MKSRIKIIISKILNVGLIVLLLGLVGNYIYRLPQFSKGAVAPDFSFIDREGINTNLSALKENYVLLDFWGSWCGPCRQESSDLVAIFDQYDDITFSDGFGFEMVSIGIEKDSLRWVRAIEKDGKRWKNNVLQKERFSSPIAALYGVKQIPTKYLLDPNGIVLSTNPTYDEIIQFLSSKL